jgi:octaprenyl-diphosphate synthase
MASLPASVTAPIAAELQLFERRFSEAMKSKVALLEAITRYIVKRKGKQVRPMFVFLSAHLHGGVTEATYTAASLVELLHTATLVHDDVVDDSLERRGFFSTRFGKIKSPYSLVITCLQKVCCCRSSATSSGC